MGSPPNRFWLNWRGVEHRVEDPALDAGSDRRPRSDRSVQSSAQRFIGGARRTPHRRARSLAATPFQGRTADTNSVRLLSIPDIQYIITYRIEDSALWIVRVHHAREDRGT
ncbi:hypothetical protein DBR17_01955 [Sphingomonas sp. HMWF008]|nr:hypothetical protein DBR17_01955 [Sphingomonas sp. HMWF008]